MNGYASLTQLPFDCLLNLAGRKTTFFNLFPDRSRPIAYRIGAWTVIYSRESHIGLEHL